MVDYVCNKVVLSTVLRGSKLAFFFSAKNETLALPAESKTPEVEKVAGQPVTGKKMLLRKNVTLFQRASEL